MKFHSTRMFTLMDIMHDWHINKNATVMWRFY